MSHQPLIGSMLLAAASVAQRNAAQQAWPAGYYEQEAVTLGHHEQEAELAVNERKWPLRANACATLTLLLQGP